MKHQIDNRWGWRRNLIFDVLIYYRGTPVVKSRCLNISRCGMFIETGPLTFFRNTPLEVVFMLGDGQQKKKYRLQAIVKYSSNKGIGVMLDGTFMPRLLQQTV